MHHVGIVRTWGAVALRPYGWRARRRNFGWRQGYVGGPPQKAGPCILAFGRDLLWRRVALAGRPSGPEARSANSVSLFCRSAPRPNFLKLKRITGHKSLHLQAQLEIAQGRGARATAYCQGGSMDKREACGIEVSAQELVVALTGKKGEAVLQRFANTVAGQEQLLRTLTRRGKRVSVCLEATGMYGLDVALRLSAEEALGVLVATPRAVRHCARAMMQRSKNDQLDAVVLWEFAARMPFTAWARPGKNTLALWAIARRLEALTKQCTAEKNREHAAGISQAIPECVRRSVARTLRFLQREMKQLREEALRCIAGDARLQRRYELLLSVPGIGEVSAVQLLAELLLLPEDRDVRQWVAYAGLDPR